MEDYIEQIYLLIHTKGYARVTDVAEALLVHPSSVTKMIQKLDKESFVKYEKYRGFILTEKGTKIGKRLVFRHDLLEEFLKRSEEHTSELQSRENLVCRLLLEKKKRITVLRSY